MEAAVRRLFPGRHLTVNSSRRCVTVYTIHTVYKTQMFLYCVFWDTLRLCHINNERSLTSAFGMLVENVYGIHRVSSTLFTFPVSPCNYSEQSIQSIKSQKIIIFKKISSLKNLLHQNICNALMIFLYSCCIAMKVQ